MVDCVFAGRCTLTDPLAERDAVVVDLIRWCIELTLIRWCRPHRDDLRMLMKGSGRRLSCADDFVGDADTRAL
jgi:hypothetical protein